jgi:ABC-type branched-subunit amino acid transport system ATPase component/ABC-type branched-subunit amino acid transport system permease subunit
MATAAQALAPPQTRSVGRTIAKVLFWTLILGFPWIASSVSWLGLGSIGSANLASIAVLAALSVVILTGWIGQISLCQAAFLGMGAYSAGQVQNHFGITFPWHLAIAGLVGGLTALVIGIPALRLKGLYLAIATLTFQWAMESSFFRFQWFSGGLDGVRIKGPVWGPANGIFKFALSDQRVFYYFAWMTVLILAVLAANLRDSKVGRAWFAIRGSETAARTLGIDTTRYKLIGFVFSGFYAGVAGGILLNWINVATFDQFLFDKSLTYMSTAVLGGIVHLMGSFIAGLSFGLLSDILRRFSKAGGFFPIFVGGIVIITILMNPGGLAHTFQELGHKLRHLMARRRGHEVAAAPTPVTQPPGEGDGEASGTFVVPAAGLESSEVALAGDEGVDGHGDTTSVAVNWGNFESRELPEEPYGGNRKEAEQALVVNDVTVRFGGVVANNGVSLEVRKGELAGLIGPNGAGKTTMFNVVSGLVEQNAGQILMLGQNVSNAPVHQRAKLGLGRTFQLIRLFPRLTVFDNLMVATHLENSAGFWSSLFLMRKARRSEAEARKRVQEIIDFIGLQEVANKPVAGLPFGVLRMVELARALVLRPKVLLLDEPASGLDHSETDQLGKVLLDIRDRFDLSLLLIEHDMRIVMLICDYVYVLDFGSLLAEGPPATIQNDERVISAYLGDQDEEQPEEQPVAVG